jgi:hypothetical protein
MSRVIENAGGYEKVLQEASPSRVQLASLTAQAKLEDARHKHALEQLETRFKLETELAKNKYVLALETQMLEGGGVSPEGGVALMNDAEVQMARIKGKDKAGFIFTWEKSDKDLWQHNADFRAAFIRWIMGAMAATRTPENLILNPLGVDKFKDLFDRKDKKGNYILPNMDWLKNAFTGPSEITTLNQPAKKSPLQERIKAALGHTGE